EAVNLRAAVLRDVVFEDCLLRDVDFGDARLTAPATCPDPAVCPDPAACPGTAAAPDTVAGPCAACGSCCRSASRGCRGSCIVSPPLAWSFGVAVRSTGTAGGYSRSHRSTRAIRSSASTGLVT
ncbi:hypothetical protein ACWC5I_28635, partial [Kitasatospora sp. NPDC001574]